MLKNLFVLLFSSLLKLKSLTQYSYCDLHYVKKSSDSTFQFTFKIKKIDSQNSKCLIKYHMYVDRQSIIKLVSTLEIFSYFAFPVRL